jgi:organic hydroperoxide reductase OsmC/OhrA
VAKPAPFPHNYTVKLEDRRLVAPPRAPIAIGAPPQFGGRDEVWSPEELLVGAALECLWTTFEAYARHDELEVEAWRGTGTGVLDKGPIGPVFTSITLAVEITVAAADTERARRVLDTAEKHCIISNALRVAVTLQADIRPR